MAYSQPELWLRFQKYYSKFPELGLSRDINRVGLPDGLRVHDEKSWGKSDAFGNLLLICIGGSASGARFVSRALGRSGNDQLKIAFVDKTDPDDIDNMLSFLPVTTKPHTIHLSIWWKELATRCWNAKPLHEPFFESSSSSFSFSSSIRFMVPMRVKKDVEALHEPPQQKKKASSPPTLSSPGGEGEEFGVHGPNAASKRTSRLPMNSQAWNSIVMLRRTPRYQAS